MPQAAGPGAPPPAQFLFVFGLLRDVLLHDKVCLHIGLALGLFLLKRRLRNSAIVSWSRWVLAQKYRNADAERFLPMLERHIEFYGRTSRQAAADGAATAAPLALESRRVFPITVLVMVFCAKRAVCAFSDRSR